MANIKSDINLSLMIFYIVLSNSVIFNGYADSRIVPPRLPSKSTSTPSRIAYHDSLISVKGYRLDWCLTWGGKCGKPIADLWCEINNRSKLSHHAVDYKKAENIGAISPTYIYQSKAICRSADCDGFEYIICEPDIEG